MEIVHQPKQYSYLRSLDKEWLDNRERELGNRISKAEAKEKIAELVAKKSK
jgi:hypothetical protein